ncbi:MAG TPA: RluA family pseudouridine synthase [Candidatus Saccharimonadales bacterium]|jgi:23S rRNA pseudouridine1911/1915/1917 synthase|nr:RluA family pseudouridine synthase [Candidatus Saccharimonadales bacterium]
MKKNFISSTEGIRIDKYLSELIADQTRSDLSKIFASGQVLVNSKKVKQSYKLKLDDTITVSYQIQKFDPKDYFDIPIIFENSDVIVIDKPAGVLSHSKGKDNQEQTVETFIHDKLIDNDYPRAGIVHRLDRATSGVMICAKTRDSYKFLQQQFSQRKVTKVYYAIVSGHFDVISAIIDLPIMRDKKNQSRFKVDSRGKNSLTKYLVVEENDDYSLLELEPKTGRTHQLRVHLKYLKHPIVGDTFYDGENADRLYLHAGKLVIRLPNGKLEIFESKTPESFSRKMKYN